MLTILKNCFSFRISKGFLIYKTLNSSSARYCQQKQRNTTKKAIERYQNLSKDEKDKKQQYGRER